MPAVPNGSVMMARIFAGEVSEGLPDKQMIRLFYWLKTGSAADDAVEATAFNTALETAFKAKLVACTINAWAWQNTKINMVYPSHEIEHNFTWAAGTGSIGPDDSMPSRTACLTLYTNRYGRKGIGHKYIGPIPMSWCIKCLLATPVPAALTTLATQFKTDLTVGGNTYTPIVYKWLKNAAAQEVPDARMGIVTVLPAKYAVYLKSRRVGRGS